MSLDVDAGCAAETGRRGAMDDCAGARLAGGDDALLIAALADGVSSGGLGALAAQSSVAVLLEDGFAAPPTWDISVALDRVIAAHNDWLVAHNRRMQGRTAEQGGGSALTTLTALALRGQGYTVAHVGDSRAWLIRDGQCQPLTQDHSLAHPDLRSGLTRALGLDDRVRVDYVQGDLQVGDVFVLTTDGVHGVLKRRQILACAAEGEAATCARALVRMALEAGSADNASAIVVRVKALADPLLHDAQRHARVLPVPARLVPGESVDGLVVREVVADTGVRRVARVHDAATGRDLALKTLHPSRAADPEERAMLAHEAWLIERVARSTPRGFVRPASGAAEPTAFYVLTEWHAGRSLEAMLQAGPVFAVAAVVDAAVQIADALGRLHRLGVVHRDIKPANLHLGDDGQWRVLDLGVALSGREPAALRDLHAGTPSYMNPEQWTDDPQVNGADASSDLFALGVTLYRWLTGRLPYGDVEPWQLGRYRRDPIPPSRLRPEVPIWLDHIVLRAVALDRRQRFETAEELGLALERGAARPVSAPAPRPLLARYPASAWQIALAVSVLLNLLLIFWLLFLPH